MAVLRRPIVPIEKWVCDQYYLGNEAFGSKVNGRMVGLRSFWRDQIVAYFRGDRRNILFTGSSRCVPLGCRVAFSDGYARIGDKVPQDFEGFSEAEGLSVFDGESVVPVSRTFFKKRCVVRHFVVDCGREVSGTLNHPILAVKGGVKGLYSFRDLSVGDWVCFHDRPLDVGVDRYPVGQYYALGQWLGDGYRILGRGGKSAGIGFMSADLPVIREVSRIVGKGYRVVHVAGKRDAYHIHFSNVFGDLAGTIFEAVHLGAAQDKFVPECVFTASLTARVAFFRGILDSDGSFSQNRFNFDVASRGLRDGVAEVLGTLGIPYSLSEKEVKLPLSGRNLNLDRCSRVYRLHSMVGRVDQWAVCDLYPGFKRVPGPEDFTPHPLQAGGCVPVTLEEGYYFNRLPKRSCSWHLRAKASVSPATAKTYNGRRLWKRLRASLRGGFVYRESVFNLQEAHYWIPDSLQEKFSSGYYHRITSEYFSDEDVADITVPGKHLFLGQGCVNHNSGKSYAIILIIIRYIYEIWIHEDFPTLFGLSSTTLPKIIFFSFSDDKARSVGISRLIRMIDQIPFFQHSDRKRRAISTIVAFPWVEVWPGTQVEHAIGDDVFAGILDEANIRGVAKAREVAEAQELFMELRMRSETTYSRNGVWAGFSAIISTAGKSTSFTDMEVAKAQRDGSRFLVQAAVYDVYPEGYSRERFAVYPGDGNVPSFIVDAPSQDVVQAITSAGSSLEQFLLEKEGLMAHPPASLRHFYEENIEVALQNLSGLTRTGSSLFIANQSLISKMFDSGMRYPTRLFLQDGIPRLGLYDTLLPEELVDEDMVNSVYSGEPVYASFDISRVNDHTGFSAIFYSADQRKILPVLVTPIYLNRALAGNEIDQVKLFGLVLALFRLGVNFRMITCDGYSSDYIIQRCKLLLGNDRAARFSVDKTVAAYITMLNFMKLGMYRLYDVPRLRYELENLVYDPYVGKVNHPPNTDSVNPVFWKDVSDSLAAASFQLAVFEDLSYEDMATQDVLAKARAVVAEGGEGPEDFYGGLDSGEDFFSDIGLRGVEREEFLDPVEKFMRDLLQ